MFTGSHAAPLEQIYDPLFEQHKLKVYIKREDLIHPVISGNKWHKLKYNLRKAIDDGHDTVVSFGGAYSNHIHALAYAGKLAGLKTVGFIRGEVHSPLNSTLQFACDQGMQLRYLDRQTYRQKHVPQFINHIKEEFGDCYIVPEGGSNLLAVQGCSEIVAEIHEPFDVVLCACGTGATLAGLICGLQSEQRAIGVSALKGGQFLTQEIEGLLNQAGLNTRPRWHVEYDYHFGGYAKKSDVLVQFVAEFEARHGIAIEPIYTGKLLFALYDLIARGVFNEGETLVVLHSGGLQGRGG